MGTCCTSRTDADGNQKTGKGSTSKGSVKFNATDVVRNTVTQVLKDTANHEILVLNVPMASFADFMKDLHSLLQLIKQQTDKVFVPICLTHSPVSPKDHFIIVLRTHENVQSFGFKGWFTDNIPVLAKKFVTKTIKLDPKVVPGTYGNQLTVQLKQLYTKEGLNLIGGFQDSKNQLNLLFFKLDKLPTQELELFTETYQPGANVSVDNQKQAIEDIINQSHLENQGVLRCALTVENGKDKAHIFVFELIEIDLMYMIMRFNSSLQTQLEMQTQGGKNKAATPFNFDEMLTKSINAEEHKISRTSALASLVINRDFGSSFIVTTS